MRGIAGDSDACTAAITYGFGILGYQIHQLQASLDAASGLLPTELLSAGAWQKGYAVQLFKKLCGLRARGNRRHQSPVGGGYCKRKDRGVDVPLINPDSLP